MPRRHAFTLAVGFATLVMCIKNFFFFWENAFCGNLRVQCTVIFMRVQMFMCNYVDAEHLDDPVKSKHLISYERKFAAYARELPSFYDWASYNLFTPFSFIGESIEYGLYDNFINMRGDIIKMRPHSNVIPAIQRFVHSLICFVVFYYLSIIAEPFGMATPEFMEHNWIYKFIFLLIAANSKIYNLFSRFVYHEAGLIASGISYKAKDEKNPEEFNSIRCMDINSFNWGSTAKDSISKWNMRTQHWLKYYVMMRFMDRDMPRGSFQLSAILKTFAVSAIFHGYYIGYYLFFSGLFLLDLAWKLMGGTAFAAYVSKRMPE